MTGGGEHPLCLTESQDTPHGAAQPGRRARFQPMADWAERARIHTPHVTRSWPPAYRYRPPTCPPPPRTARVALLAVSITCTSPHTSIIKWVGGAALCVGWGLLGEGGSVGARRHQHERACAPVRARDVVENAERPCPCAYNRASVYHIAQYVASSASATGRDDARAGTQTEPTSEINANLCLNDNHR